jgi:nuclear transport factor 2 (NTF2) superfamily protein
MIKNNHFETFNNSDMKTTIDKSRLMKRAWYLVKNQGYTLAYSMKKVWKEMKNYIIEKAEQAKRDLIPEYQGCNIQPTAEAMFNFYNSNVYKGD